MARLKLQNVSKSYDAKNIIIKNIELDVDDGEFIVIIGPSGCGKSTLLRMVAGLEQTTSGDIYINEDRVTHKEPKDRGIAMVFQNYALYPHMSVFDNIAYALKIRGFAKEYIDNKVRDVADMLELEPLLSRKPKELSGGQRQRVAMGRAIIREPTLFLFDEPLSNLDAKLRVQMRLELQQLHRRLKVTSLYVTHDQVEAMTLADRVIILNKGVVEQVGTPLEVYQRPASRFVASFMGSPAMNLLDGQLNADGSVFQIAGGAQLKLKHPMASYADQPITLGIRPEHILSAYKDKSDLILDVNVIERLGADNLAHTQWGKQKVVVRLPHYENPKVNSELAVTFSPSDLHFFDINNGRRISI